MISAARRFVVVAEASKKVDRLGEGFRLPVEVVRFAWKDTRRRLSALLPDAGAAPSAAGSEPYVTDEGHYILDAPIPEGSDPLTIAAAEDAFRAWWSTASSSTWPSWRCWGTRTAAWSASSAEPLDRLPEPEAWLDR